MKPRVRKTVRSPALEHEKSGHKAVVAMRSYGKWNGKLRPLCHRRSPLLVAFLSYQCEGKRGNVFL